MRSLVLASTILLSMMLSGCGEGVSTAVNANNNSNINKNTKKSDDVGNDSRNKINKDSRSNTGADTDTNTNTGAGGDTDTGTNTNTGTGGDTDTGTNTDTDTTDTNTTDTNTTTNTGTNSDTNTTDTNTTTNTGTNSDTNTTDTNTTTNGNAGASYYLKINNHITINKQGTVATYVSSDINKSEKLIYNTDALKKISKELYTHFKDEYDFIFLVTNNKERPSTISYSGVFSKVKNDVEGIGAPLYDNTSLYGSSGKLKGIMHFGYRGAILRGPTLHEMCHYWANKFNFDMNDANGYRLGSGSHWGETSFYGGKGQLGGSDAHTLKRDYTYTYTDSKSRVWTLRSADSYWWNANGGNGLPYNDVELYLMGLLPKSDVANLFIPSPYGMALPPKVINDQDFKDTIKNETNRRYFMAVEMQEKTWSGLLSEQGVPDRNPDYTSSQKKFRILTVLLDTQMPKQYEIGIIDAQIKSLAFKGDDNNAHNYNFWEATRGVGSLKVDGVDTLKTAATKVSLNDNFTQESINFHGKTYKTIHSKYTNRVWLDRNIGASKVCEAYNDGACYGDYFQWGRGFDGHEKSNSSNSATKINSLDNTNDKFITTQGTSSNDWVESGVDDDGSLRESRWASTDGSSVCPQGFRVPTKEEFQAETISNEYADSFSNRDDAYASFLKLPSAGYKNNQDSSAGKAYENTHGMYWTKNVLYAHSSNITYIHFREDDTLMYSTSHRAMGGSVRCIKD